MLFVIFKFRFSTKCVILKLIDMWRTTFEIGAGQIKEVVPAQELSWIQRCRVNKALDPVYNGPDKFFYGQKFARMRLLFTRHRRGTV